MIRFITQDLLQYVAKGSTILGSLCIIIQNKLEAEWIILNPKAYEYLSTLIFYGNISLSLLILRFIIKKFNRVTYETSKEIQEQGRP